MTKFELQQQVNKLAADNLFLREQLSLLQTRLTDADHRARRLIASHNRNLHGVSDRRVAMEAAREAAKHTGLTTKVGGNHA